MEMIMRKEMFYCTVWRGNFALCSWQIFIDFKLNTHLKSCRPSHQPDECIRRPIFKWIRAQSHYSDALQKCPGLHRHSSKKWHLRRQAINLAPSRRVRTLGHAPTWGSSMPVKAHLDRLPPQPGHTRPDWCLSKHGWSIEVWNGSS